MKIAIGGKGGTGKTTVAGTLARWLGRAERDVLAIDGDSNPNLASILGLSGEAAAVPELPPDLFRTVEGEDGTRRRELAIPLDEVVRRHAAAGPDRVRLLVGARVDHAGAG